MELLLRPLQRLIERLLVAWRPGGRGLSIRTNVDAGSLRQRAQCLGKLYALSAHDEAEDIATDVAYPALPGLPLRVYLHAGSGVVMPRTDADINSALATKIDVAAYQFHEIDGLGALSLTSNASPTIEEEPDHSLGGRLVYRSVQLSRTESSMPARRAILTVDDPGDWVPNGFEVKIVGASGSRKVWLHLVVESPSSRGRVVVHPSTMIASARDM